MKKIITLLSLVILFSACKKDEKNTYYAIGIDVQSDFMQDSVVIYIDDAVVMNKVVETYQALGVCLEGKSNLTRKEGNHTIKAVVFSLMSSVNHAPTKTETFTLNKDHYIGVNYDRQTAEISFVHSDEPFVYD